MGKFLSFRRGVAAAVVAIAGQSATAAVTVDGNLSDWGITPANNYTNWGSGIASSPHSIGGDGGVKGFATIGSGPTAFNFSYHVEDTNDFAGPNVQVGPLYGGQDYDAEFLGVGFDGPNLVISILSGQRFDNLAKYFSPGDVRIETTNGLFGVETTGATYNIKNDGTTQSAVAAPGAAGTIWRTAESDWKTNSPLSPLTPVQIAGGSLLDSVLFSYVDLTGNADTHAAIEMSIPLSILFGNGPGSVLAVQWGPSCGNDLLRVTDIPTPPEPAPPAVPEPSSIALLGLGAFGLGARKWQRRVQE